MAIQDITAGRGALANVTQATTNLQNANTQRMQGFTNGILQMSQVLQNYGHYKNSEEMRTLQKDKIKADTGKTIAETGLIDTRTKGEELDNTYKETRNQYAPKDIQSQINLRNAQANNFNANAENTRYATGYEYAYNEFLRTGEYPQGVRMSAPSVFSKMKLGITKLK